MELATIADLTEARLTFESANSQELPLPIQRIGPSPCTLACPAGVNVKAYVSLIAEGRFIEALQVVRERCPLPGVCGRVCTHPCESVCRRTSEDTAVAIRALKRFAADVEAETPAPPPAPRARRPEQVAVIGSGPSGLTCAYELGRRGFQVTLYEAEPELGGMLRYGIPEYRLPRAVLDYEIDWMLGPTVSVEAGTALGRDLGLEELFGRGHRAIYLAVGATKSRRLGLEGERGARGIEDALAFLKRVNRGDRTSPGRNVLVVGGGSSAFDAARTARRLGAERVEIVYRRSREEMPGAAEEIRAAREEGVVIRYLVMPAGLELEGGRARGLRCLEARLGAPDASGRRRPIPVAGSDFTLPADCIVPAIGQEPHLPFLDPANAGAVTSEGRLRARPETLMTGVQGVFAGGDAVSGPATVIEAIAAGARAARAIAAYLELGPARFDPGVLAAGTPERWELGMPDPPVLRQERHAPPERAPDERLDFDEMELRYAAADAVAEAGRCLRCGPCSECRSCASTCQRRHVLVRSQAPQGDGGTATTTRGGGGAAGAPGNGGQQTIDLLLRTPTPSAFARAHEQQVVGRLAVPSVGRGMTGLNLPVTVSPAHARIDRNLCRGCGRCVEVCSFSAPSLGLHPGPHGEPVSRVEPLLCRGCGLCVSVCTTGAAAIEPFSRGWIVERVLSGNGHGGGDRHGSGHGDGADSRAGAERGQAPATVLITCQRRGGCLAPASGELRPGSPVLRLPCAGQLDAGTVLELIRRGAARVVVAGCASERCRFRTGAQLAQEQVTLARRLLALANLDPERAQGDWSASREHDALSRELTAAHTTPGGA